MRYTTDDQGVLNNYAIEPGVYLAQYPSQEEQQQYSLQAAIAVLFVALTVFVAFGIS